MRERYGATRDSLPRVRGWLGLGIVALLMCAIGAPAQAATTPPTLTVEVIGQGTVTGTGINCGSGHLSCYSAYGSGSPAVTLTPAAASGWTFTGWEDACSSSPCAVTPAGSQTVTAVFDFSGVVQTSTLNVSATHGDVVNGAMNYPIECDSSKTAPAGTTCSLTALTGSTLTMTETPDAGYLFTGWGGACSGAGPSCAVYLASSQSMSAGFVQSASTTLTVTVSGNGSVTGGGISCGAGTTCSTPESSTATVTLTASPASGYALTDWSGGCTGIQATCTVQMSAAVSVTATFQQVVPLSVTVTGNGYVTGGRIGCDGTDLGQTCTANEVPGTDVTLTATANSGGGTPYWTGCYSSSGSTCTISNITSATAVSVSFSGSGGSTGPVSTNLLTVTVHGDGYVQAFAGSNSIYCTAAGGAGCSASVAAGTSITLSAVPASRSTTDFTSWGGACASFTSTTCTLTMSSAATATATFVGGNTTYSLTAQPSGSGTISGAGLDCAFSGASGCSSPQAAGASVTLTATPDFGATFSGWGGACAGTATTCTVTMTTAKVATAAFSGGFGGSGSSSLILAVTGAGKVTAEGISCAGAAGKTKTCEGSYATGKKVTLAAKPAAGYVLSAWTGGCSGAKPTCALTLASTKSVGAKFIRAVLTATHTPTVVTTKAGRRVTLWFHAGVAGVAQVVAERAGKVVLRHWVKVEPGGRHVLVTVRARGRYVLTLTLVKHTLRWRVTV